MKPLRLNANNVARILWVAAFAATVFGYLGIVAPGEAYLGKVNARSAELGAKTQIARTSLEQLGAIGSGRRRVEAGLNVLGDGSQTNDGTSAVRAADLAGRNAGVVIVSLALSTTAPIEQIGDGLQGRDVDVTVRGTFHHLLLFLAQLGIVGVPLEVRTVQIHVHQSGTAESRLLDATIKARLYRWAENNNDDRKENNASSIQAP
jgi:hypothetical protein